MKRQKTLFDLFRDNAHKLEETPSRQSWQRLEARLDRHRQHSRMLSIRQFAVAAAVGGIVLLAALFSMLTDRGHAITYHIETLDRNEVNEEALEALALSKRFEEGKPASFAEGRVGQKLVPR
ncbi:MAG: hypothetical protein HUU34_18230 [Saprospiraceae bacterium]|nr:hypothetical protein [Saprospiraceae bacterium]